MKQLLFSCFLFLASLSILALNGFTLIDPLIPKDEILRGGPPKDGIPALNHPKFIHGSKAVSSFSKEDYALIIKGNKTTKAYPISILNWHEVVNDEIDGRNVVISYCPLCGAGIVFDSMVKNRKLTFGVSGLLYQSDVLLYDKETESLWSQLLLKSVNGKEKGSTLKIYPSSHVNLRKYLEEKPETLVLSKDTGFLRDYSRNPYGDYESSNTLYFPVNTLPKSRHYKEWSLIILSKDPLIIPLSSLEKKMGRISLKTKLGKIIVQYNKDTREMTCFNKASYCVTGYFFALKTFYPNARIYP